MYNTLMLLTGMLSKSRGQVLRVAVAFHVLFNMNNPSAIPDTISINAMKAALNFVEVCNQNVAYLAGRGQITDAIDRISDALEGKT